MRQDEAILLEGYNPLQKPPPTEALLSLSRQQARVHERVHVGICK